MPTLQEIKQELLGLVKDPSLLPLCEAEIKKMESTEGLDDKLNLEKFYSLYKMSKTRSDNHRNVVNSWLAYATGMVTKKPDEGSTFFPKRRAFARKSLPDVDSDFDYERRGEIYQYLIDTFGREYVGNIGTYSGLKTKSYVRRAIKAIDPEKTFFKGFDFWKTETNALGAEILDSLPPQYGAKLKVKDDQGNEHIIDTVADAAKYCKKFSYYITKYPSLLQHSHSIEGLLSTFGVHAAGIVISSEPLGNIAPLRQSKIADSATEEGPKYAYATQFEYNDLEFLGLIKFDILALSTLSVIYRCMNMIEQNYGIKVNIYDLPLDDKKTYDLYKSGKLTGVFQCEEYGMQKTMVNMGVDSLHDIMAGIALYRPGPMDYIETYCARKHGVEPIDYFHSSLKPLLEQHLKKTYGLPVYQEQIMQVCNAVAGLSIPEGYVVIKAIGKKKPELLQKYRTRFVTGAKETNGIEPKVAEGYWDKVITPFADYGFNKAHACCYAYNSYATAYLKANYPEEFVASYLNVEVIRANYDKIATLEKMADEMNITILPRHINTCKLEYTIAKRADATNGVPGSEIMPSIRCKGLSFSAAEEIVKHQPYASLKEFAEFTDTKLVDMRALEALIEAGFFKPKQGRSRPAQDILDEFEMMREDLKKLRKRGIEGGNMFE